MLSEKADLYIRDMKYNPEAGIISNYLPLTMLYWEDEITEEVADTWSEDDKFWIYILVRIRCEMWKGNLVEDEDMEIWDHCLSTYPDCPIFKRINVDQSIIDSQLALENETWDFLDDNGFEPVKDEEKK